MRVYKKGLVAISDFFVALNNEIIKYFSFSYKCFRSFS